MARFELSARDTVEYAPQGGGADALFQLGLAYCTGRDGIVDLVQAHKWFNLATLRGNAAAKSYRQDVASEMTKAEVARAQRLAREWLSVN
jgi:TPR repeat protein